jgi:hypothetical protein
MNSEAMQKPVANEGADDANRRVADETETTAPYNLARQPSDNDPDDQNDNQTRPIGTIEAHGKKRA